MDRATLLATRNIDAPDLLHTLASSCWSGTIPNATGGPYPQYGWDFPEEIPEKIPERPRKRSQSVSWNSRREYGWDAPNPIIQGI